MHAVSRNAERREQVPEFASEWLEVCIAALMSLGACLWAQRFVYLLRSRSGFLSIRTVRCLPTGSDVVKMKRNSTAAFFVAVGGMLFFGAVNRSLAALTSYEVQGLVDWYCSGQPWGYPRKNCYMAEYAAWANAAQGDADTWASYYFTANCPSHPSWTACIEALNEYDANMSLAGYCYSGYMNWAEIQYC